MSVRIYLPLTLAGLAAYDAAGAIPETVLRFTAEDDSEDAEYAAMRDAADASAELLAGRPGRRVVAVAEVTVPAGPIPISRLVAVHVDAREGADPDDDLAWFGAQEIPDLL